MEGKKFEELLKELESVVKTLENKETPLDEAIKKYKEGLDISKQCYKMLEEAENILIKDATI